MQFRIVPDVISGQELAELDRKASVQIAARLMAKRGLGAILITGDGRLEGIFTERDVSFRVVTSDLPPDTTSLAEVMTADPDTIAPDDTPLSALRQMRAGNYRHLPVCDGSRLIGIVSIRDVYSCARSQLEEELHHLQDGVASQCKIVPDVIRGQEMAALDPTATVLDAARLMAQRGLGAILVTDGGTLKGIFTERDVSFRVVAAGLPPDTTPLAEVMTADPDTIAPDEACGRVLKQMSAGNFRHLPVVDGDCLVGIVSVRDILACVESQLEDDFGRALAGRAQRIMRSEE